MEVFIKHLVFLGKMKKSIGTSKNLGRFSKCSKIGGCPLGVHYKPLMEGKNRVSFMETCNPLSKNGHCQRERIFFEWLCCELRKVAPVDA